MQTRKTSIISWMVAVFIGFAGLSSCLKSTAPQSPPAKSYVSIMYLAATAPSSDVFFNDEKVSNNAFTPGSVSSAYNAVEKGTFSIKLKKASSDSVIASVPLALYDSLRFYTIFIYNLQANGPAEAVRIEDDFAQLAPGKTFYRFFHASPNVNSVDLYIDNLKIEFGRTLADNAIQQSLNEFREFASGSHTFDLKVAGTDSILVSRNIEFTTGNVYTLYLKGLKGGSNNTELSLQALRAVN